MLYGVIMAGGSGTRFWPRSRRALAKHHLAIAGERTMLQQTFDRLRVELAPEQILVVTIADQAKLTSEQLPELPAENVIAEPEGRNTAACVGLAAITVHARAEDPTMLVVTADHVIRPYDIFWQDVRAATDLAADGQTLGIFGIRPTWGNPGFGYILRGEPASESSAKAFVVAKFEEKPEPPVAERFARSGEYYWNSGMFVWKTSTILRELHQHAPGISQYLERIADAIGTAEEKTVLADLYPRIPKQPIDKAVMEHASHVKVIEASFDWDDVGSWKAVPNHHESDERGNTVLALHQSLDTEGCIIAAEPGHLVATIGVSDLIIVQTPDATLVCRKDDAERVKEIVEALKDAERKEFL